MDDGHDCECSNRSLLIKILFVIYFSLPLDIYRGSFSKQQHQRLVSSAGVQMTTRHKWWIGGQVKMSWEIDWMTTTQLNMCPNDSMIPWQITRVRSSSSFCEVLNTLLMLLILFIYLLLNSWDEIKWPNFRGSGRKRETSGRSNDGNLSSGRSLRSSTSIEMCKEEQICIPFNVLSYFSIETQEMPSCEANKSNKRLVKTTQRGHTPWCGLFIQKPFSLRGSSPNSTQVC